MQDNEVLYMGIDGGGTKCRVRIESADGRLLGCGIGGTANPSHGMKIVIDSILDATDMALAEANLGGERIKDLVVGAGLAGLHLPTYFSAVAGWQHPFRQLYLSDDLEVANLGAHGGGDGAVIIVGTGFSSVAMVGNHKRVIGGHGFLMGERCSGSWIGHQAVQVALLDQDGLGPKTRLTDLLEAKFNGRGAMLANALVGFAAKDFAAIAPLVFEAAALKDEVANKILDNSAQFVAQVAKLLLESKPPRLCLVGSIAERLSDRLEPHIAKAVVPLMEQPESGAIYLARNEFSNTMAANRKP